MIAQEFALQYPRRVRSLILGCTAAGGPTVVRAEAEVNRIVMSRELTPEQMAQAMRPYVYDSHTSAEKIDEDLEVRRKWFPKPQGYAAQVYGILAWESYSRLPQITAPTLVIHGESDLLIPPANGKLIAERIPGAEFVLLPDASHIFATDQPEAAHKAVLKFLSEHWAGARTGVSVIH
jgi:pimeloyl-ACP methyl ester carboxylesterase